MEFENNNINNIDNLVEDKMQEIKNFRNNNITRLKKRIIDHIITKISIGLLDKRYKIIGYCFFVPEEISIIRKHSKILEDIKETILKMDRIEKFKIYETLKYENGIMHHALEFKIYYVGREPNSNKCILI